MKVAAFEYLRTNSLSEAFAAYESYGEDAGYLAGGHSVVPALALRLQAPSILIDISAIKELSGIEMRDGWLRIGAMTRHVQVLNDPTIKAHAPLLSAAAAYVAHPAIRNRGTIGGSVALADPAAEFPAMMLALRAELEIAGEDGVRRVPAADFFIDLYETAIAPGEILLSILLPPTKNNSVFAFDELARRKGDYALVGCGLQAELTGGQIEAIDIAFFSVSHVPVRALNAELALAGKPIDANSISAAQHALQDDLDPMDEPQVPSGMRRHLAAVLLGRVLKQIEAVR